MPRKQPVEKRSSRTADVQIARRRGGETNADARSHRPQITQIFTDVVAASLCEARRWGFWIPCVTRLTETRLQLIRQKSFPTGGVRGDLSGDSLLRRELRDQRASGRVRPRQNQLQKCFARATISKSPGAEAQRVARGVLALIDPH